MFSDNGYTGGNNIMKSVLTLRNEGDVSILLILILKTSFQ